MTVTKRFEPSNREIALVVETLITGGYEEQIPYHEMSGDSPVDTCPTCDGHGYEEYFDDDWFCPIEVVYIWGTLEYRERPCLECNQTGSISLLEKLQKDNELAKPAPYLGTILALKLDQKGLDLEALSDEYWENIFRKMAEDARMDPELCR